MSKFTDSIEAKILNQVAIDEFPLLDVKDSIADISQPLKLAYLYSIKMTYEIRTACKPDDLGYVKANLINNLKHDLYSQFTADLLRLERAVYARNYDVVHSAIKNIFAECGLTLPIQR